MGETTGIGWTHHTFNPWRGCSHALFPDGTAKAGQEHPGCGGCYAEELVTRWRMGGVKGEWGPGAPRTVAADSGWATAIGWAKSAALAAERRRCFFSLGDPLDEEAPPEGQERYWQFIRDTAALHNDGTIIPTSHWPGLKLLAEELGGNRFAWGLDHLLLTKRPWRWRLIPKDIRPLIWLGTSISDQPTADVWLAELLQAEGFRLLFCSYEPALGAVDFEHISPRHQPLGGEHGLLQTLNALEGRRAVAATDAGKVVGASVSDGNPLGSRLGWVIAGGMSGNERQDCEVAWFDSAAEQCAAAKVSFYMKQDSGQRAGKQGRIPAKLWALKQIPFQQAAA